MSQTGGLETVKKQNAGAVHVTGHIPTPDLSLFTVPGVCQLHCGRVRLRSPR